MTSRGRAPIVAAKHPPMDLHTRGDSCKHCGEPLAWPRPVGVILADGTAECMACFEREAWRILAAAERVVNSPDALADPAELMVRGELLP